jgi:hypothetical protein
MCVSILCLVDAWKSFRYPANRISRDLGFRVSSASAGWCVWWCEGSGVDSNRQADIPLHTSDGVASPLNTISKYAW